MARKRFRSTQRNEPVTDRSFQEYLYQTSAPLTNRTELMRLVRGGEDTYLELKVKLSNSERIAQGIVALDVQGKRRPYRTRDGRFFIRVGDNKRETSPEELSTLLDDARPLLYEDIPVTQSTISDIDEAHLWTFMRAFEGAAFEESTVKDYPTSEILERYLMLGVKSQDDIAPTVAGMLLFGADESVTRLLPRTSIIATRFGGDNVKAPIIERVELQGNLASLYEAALRFVNRYCDLWDARPARSTSEADNSPIVARANYHRAVICEAVANALIHRDLVVRDVTTRLHIFDRAIEVVNPDRK